MDTTATTLDIAAKGMQAQSQRLRVIAENLANADSTASSPDANPYQRQILTFKTVMDRASGIRTVAVDKVMKDTSDFGSRYEPGNPAADAKGYVKTPNVNPFIENMDMREGQKAYEANLSMLEQVKAMMQQTVSLIRN